MRLVAAKVRNFAKDVLAKQNLVRGWNVCRAGPLAMTTRHSIDPRCLQLSTKGLSRLGPSHSEKPYKSGVSNGERGRVI
jgi:hypothetical protein